MFTPISALIIPAPKDAQEALTQARILDRAATLANNGYTWNALDVKLYRVFKPGHSYAAGDAADYFVDLLGKTCTCKSFEKSRLCKHYLAVEKEALMIQEYEQAIEACELEETGCDPYAKF